MDKQLTVMKIFLAPLVMLASELAAQILAPVFTSGSSTFTYYVSPTGSDSNPGTRSLPWLTIAKVNATTLTPGQSVGFQRGGTWRETLMPGQSGSAGNPITFGVYGSGSAPIVSGAGIPTWAADTGTPALQETFGGTINGNGVFGGTTNNWIGHRFVPASSYTLIQIDVPMKIQGGAPFTSPVTAFIYTDSAGSPGTALATSTGTLQPTLTASYVYYTWSFSGLALTSGTSYWIVLNKTQDGTNFAVLGETSGATGALAKKGTNGTVWSAGNANFQGNLKTYVMAAALPNVWNSTVTTTPTKVWKNGILATHAASKAALTQGQWFASGTTLSYYEAAGNPGLQGYTLEAAVRNYAIDANAKNNVTIDGLAPQHANVFDVHRGAATGLLLTNLSWIAGAQAELGTVLFYGSAIDASGNIYACQTQNIGGTKGVIIKSSDGGASWNNLKVFSLGTSCLSVFVNSAGSVFMAPHGNSFPVGADQGIYRSTDGGATWMLIDNLAAYGSSTATIWGWCEDNAGRLFAGMYTQGSESGQNILRSLDGGATWVGVYNDPAGRHIHDVQADPVTGYVYATLGDNFTPWFSKGILRSTDHGVTWASILAATLQTVPICITPTSRLFALDDAGGGIYRTTDDSAFTQTLDTSPLSLFGFWMKRNPSSGNIYAGFTSTAATLTVARIYQSKDDGVTWALLIEYVTSAANDGPNYVSGIANNRLFMQYQTAANGTNGIILGRHEHVGHAEYRSQITYVFVGLLFSTGRVQGWPESRGGRGPLPRSRRTTKRAQGGAERSYTGAFYSRLIRSDYCYANPSNRAGWEFRMHIYCYGRGLFGERETVSDLDATAGQWGRCIAW